MEVKNMAAAYEIIKSIEAQEERIEDFKTAINIRAELQFPGDRKDVLTVDQNTTEYNEIAEILMKPIRLQIADLHKQFDVLDNTDSTK